MLTYRRSGGVALVFVIFIVALVAVLATTLITNQFTHIRRLENSIHLSRLLQQAYGVEAWGLEVLKQDQLSSQTDHLNENWAKPLEPTQLDDTADLLVAGQIHDLGSRYDLNRLVDKGKANLPDIGRFKTLINTLDIETDFTDSLVDWIDSNTLTQATGAEAPYYQGLKPAYYTPDRPLSHFSEIAYIKDMDAATLQQLRPLTTSLPEPTPINVNTAPAEVLTLLLPQVNVSAADALVQLRETDPFESVGSFLAELKRSTGMSEDAAKQINEQALAVNSRFFEVTSTVTFHDNVLQMHSRIYRDPNGGLRVYERELQLLQ